MAAEKTSENEHTNADLEASETEARDLIYHLLSGLDVWVSEHVEEAFHVVEAYEKMVEEAAASRSKNRKPDRLAASLAVAALYDLDEAYQDSDMSPHQVYHENIRLGGDSIQNALDRCLNPEL